MKRIRSFRDIWRQIAWKLEAFSKWMQRCTFCGEVLDTSLCESCERFFCCEHSDDLHSWDDCEICKECGIALDPDIKAHPADWTYEPVGEREP